MKLFQIFNFFIIIKISISYYYNVKLMTPNLVENIYGLNPDVSYIYFFTYSLNGDEKNYFEFQIVLDKDIYKNKLFTLEFVKDNYISNSGPFKNTSIDYSELDVQEIFEKVIIKWSKSFSFTDKCLGVAINPKSSISQISIKMFSDTIINDFVTILVFGIFFGICIFLCVLTLIKTKACGSKDSTPIIINQGNSAGLIQNELVNNSQE